jgi:glucan 1,3-beta-glucosidase
VVVYNLNTVGAVSMIDRNGNSLAKFSDNVSVFPDTVALYRTG